MLRKIRLLGALGALAVGLAPGAWAGEPANLGEAVYFLGNGKGATACAACHGQNGEGDGKAGFPRVAGLAPAYLAKQVRDYRNGSRENPTVLPIVSSLTEAEIEAVAAFMAGLKAPALAPQEADRALLEKGRWLAERGNWDKDLPACDACHGHNGQGVGTVFPALAAQQPRYAIAQISAWKFGSRRNDQDGLMKGIADRLDDEEIKAVAAYYASLPPPAGEQP